MNAMSMLAIVTARGGSKRIPRKNVRPFAGRPMLSYAVAAARESGLFDEVMVSTDDDEIASVAAACGAAVPFRRCAATAGDFATTEEVLREVFACYEQGGRSFDAFCCLYPCVPLLTGTLLREAGEAFLTSGAESLVPVVRFSYPVQRALVRGSDGFLAFREPTYQAARSQDLEPTYHDAGMFYFCRSAAFRANGGSLKTHTTAMFELPDSRVQDIDNESDWRLAELKFQLLEGGR